MLVVYNCFEMVREDLLTLETKQSHQKLARLDLEDCNGYTVLLLAIRRQNLKMVKLLLECKADANQICLAAAQTPLCCAIERENLPIVKALLQAQADVNSPGLGPALHLAVRMEDLNMVSLLLEAKANINEKPKQKPRLMVSNPDLDESDKPDEPNERTAFLQCPVDNFPLISLLLHHKAEIQQPNDSLMLEEAIRGDQFKLVQTLLKAGASVNNKGSKDLTAVIGNTSIMQLLLEWQVEWQVEDEANCLAIAYLQMDKGTRISSF